MGAQALFQALGKKKKDALCDVVPEGGTLLLTAGARPLV